MKSSYIHIPFCKRICTYCDFCKMYYSKKMVSSYLNALENEINSNYKGEMLETLYVGGGTPTSLDINELEYLLKILQKIKICGEYTFETNVESLNIDKIRLLKMYGVNRISIGVQSIVEKNIDFLGRKHKREDITKLIRVLKDNGISNINIDLIYAIPGETMEDLESDLNFIIDLDINHVSTYSLIIEPHTKLYINNIKNIDEDLDYAMYELICNKLKNNGFKHYEISNFSKDGYESKHNLTYWNNNEYYGFGLGASGYINGTRYDNTRSINEYIRGNYILNKDLIEKNIKIENEFILGLRKIDGVNKNCFLEKYGTEIDKIPIVQQLINNNSLIDDGNNVFINPEKIYISNSILVEFIGGSYGQN